jgi:hypothetical protein
MKQTMALCLSLWVGLIAYGQNKFEKGYIILENGSKIECLLKNRNWQNNPTQFEYKRNETSEVEIGRLSTVREFSVPNSFKYVRFTVEIDRSSSRLSELSTSRKPEFSAETLFLKAIVEADVNLYSYKEEKLLRFFYARSTNDIKQLIYKDYRNNLGQIVVNEAYKIQLKQFLNCGNQKVDNVSYATSDLRNYFINYNQCTSGDTTKIIDYTKNENKGIFRFGIVGGVGNSTVDVEDNTFGAFVNIEGEIGSQIAAKFGVQLEYNLPFDNYKWSLFAMPLYQSFQENKTITQGELVITRENYEVDYKSIEIPFGVRRYFPLNESSRLFIDAAYVLDVAFNSTLTTSIVQNNTEDISAGSSVSFAFGYKLNNKYGMEVRYYSSRNILASEVFREMHYSNISLLLSYNLF